ncbi:hypothetical protein [Streptomyces sp. NBC_00083]|uniref:hypothetical protein n=1 Tax=Streptomyces sp. NBC_00083 TaxID=2975647 RepID=UPI0022509005|nr:hypothetical protein [Streptomyces sp. NBC_00083]MCX5384693.1 hypothetical protein [Streptomyces sp. NBC_00083]
MPYARHSEGPELTQARDRLYTLDQQIIRAVTERVSFSSSVQSARVARGGCPTDSVRENAAVGRHRESLGACGSDIAPTDSYLLRTLNAPHSHCGHLQIAGTHPTDPAMKLPAGNTRSAAGPRRDHQEPR